MSAEPVQLQPEEQKRIPIFMPYLYLNGEGVACIENSRIKVSHLAGFRRYQGWTAEELFEQFPHLPQAAIYASLAYYYSHQEEIDRELDEEERFAEEMRAKSNQPSREELLKRWEEQRKTKKSTT